MTLNNEQIDFITTALDGDNIFLTGNAGTGKTFALAKLIETYDDDILERLSVSNPEDAKIKLENSVSGPLAPYWRDRLLTRWILQRGGILSIPKRRYFVIAPTGMAAANLVDRDIPAQTIHMFFGWTADTDMADEAGMYDLEDTATHADSPADIEAAKRITIIIDEISMVDAWTFRAMDAVMRDRLNVHSLPFGGCQVIMCGDFGQLPPINEARQMDGYEPESTPVPLTPLFDSLDVEGIRLVTCMRADATDPRVKEWCNFLDNLRIDPTDAARDFNQMIEEGEVEDSLMLCWTNRVANAHNAKMLIKHPGQIISLPEWSYGKVPNNRFRINLEVKQGCKVVVTANHRNNPLYNGYRGTVEVHGGAVMVDGYHVRVVCRTNLVGLIKASERLKIVTKENVGRGLKMRGEILANLGEIDGHLPNWLREMLQADDRDTLAALGCDRFYLTVGWPLSLGYAITVHKSQGMTLQNVHINRDVGRRQAPPALLYVAVSRVRSFEGLTRDRGRFNPSPNPLAKVIDTVTG